MNSTVIFKGGEDNFYAYDIKSKYLFYVHPILAIIDQYADKDKESLKNIINNMNYSYCIDFDYYYQKYLYLKSNGFFSNINPDELLTGSVSVETIKQNLSNLNQVVFQVTSDCNMKCSYCCFGELYNGEKVKITYMDLDKVHRIFSFLIPYWKSGSSLYENTINIGFYGGEPLLNISLIKDIVSYCVHIQEKENIKFEYSITTNATLLPKHIDYLAKHQFNLLISLDGNEYHDSYRVDRENHPTFHRVFNNIKYIQENYNKYFREKVFFNSVLTNKSNVADIHNFIYEHFQKIPLIEPVSTTDLKESRISDFKQIDQEYNESLELLRKRSDYSNVGKEIGRFFYYNLSNSFHYYADLLYEEKNLIYKRIPTGTCLPFGKKIYITSEGNILACEKIATSHIWGYIDSQNVTIDLNDIVSKYNSYINKIRNRCQNCYRFDTCPVCIFQLKIENNTPLCPYSITENALKKYLSNIVNVLEKENELFFKFNDLIFL